MVWAEHEWVEQSVRRRGTTASIALIALLLIGAALYVIGLITIASGIGLLLAFLGLLALLTTAGVAMVAYPYRRVAGETAPATVFHISPSLWTPGETITLDVMSRDVVSVTRA